MENMDSCMSDQLLIHQITAGLSFMTPAEKRVARIVLSDYPSAGLFSIAKLAELSHVSGPTVLRFVKRLGLEGYLEFQSRLLGELSHRKSFFTDAYEDRIFGVKDQNLIQYFIQLHQKKLVASLTKLPPAEFEHAIQLLSNLRTRVTCTGGRFTDFLAKYLALRLHELRPGIRFSETFHDRRNEHVLDINNKDIIVVFDVRHYQKDTVEFARGANKNRAKIILLTDPHLSPIASVATCVLPVEVEGPSTFDSALNIIALTELLVLGVAETLGDKANARINKLNDLRHPSENNK